MLHLLLSHNISQFLCLLRILNQLQTCIELQTYTFCYNDTCVYIPHILTIHHTNQLTIVPYCSYILRILRTNVNRDEESNSKLPWTLSMQRLYVALSAVVRNPQEYVETCSYFAVYDGMFTTLCAILMCTYKTGLHENAVIAQ